MHLSRLTLALGLSLIACSASAAPRANAPAALKSDAFMGWPNQFVVGKFEDQTYRPIGDFTGMMIAIERTRGYNCDLSAQKSGRTQFEFRCEHPDKKDRLSFVVTYRDDGVASPRYILSRPSENGRPLDGASLLKFYQKLWLDISATEP